MSLRLLASASCTLNGDVVTSVVVRAVAAVYAVVAVAVVAVVVAVVVVVVVVVVVAGIAMLTTGDVEIEDLVVCALKSVVRLLVQVGVASLSCDVILSVVAIICDVMLSVYAAAELVCALEFDV